MIIAIRWKSAVHDCPLSELQTIYHHLHLSSVLSVLGDWNGMESWAILQQNGPLTTKIAILILERMPIEISILVVKGRKWSIPWFAHPSPIAL